MENVLSEGIDKGIPQSGASGVAVADGREETGEGNIGGKSRGLIAAGETICAVAAQVLVRGGQRGVQARGDGDGRHDRQDGDLVGERGIDVNVSSTCAAAVLGGITAAGEVAGAGGRDAESGSRKLGSTSADVVEEDRVLVAEAAARRAAVGRRHSVVEERAWVIVGRRVWGEDGRGGVKGRGKGGQEVESSGVGREAAQIPNGESRARGKADLSGRGSVEALGVGNAQQPGHGGKAVGNRERGTHRGGRSEGGGWAGKDSERRVAATGLRVSWCGERTKSWGGERMVFERNVAIAESYPSLLLIWVKQDGGSGMLRGGSVWDSSMAGLT